MKGLLLLSTFLFSTYSLATPIEPGKTQWKCETPETVLDNQVFCIKGKQKRAINFFRAMNATTWLVQGNLLLQKKSDIEEAHEDGHPTITMRRQLSSRKNGSLVYDLNKGEWLDSELTSLTLPYAEYADVNLLLVFFKPLIDGRTIVDSCLETPTGTECSNGILSIDGKTIQ